MLCVANFGSQLTAGASNSNQMSTFVAGIYFGTRNFSSSTDNVPFRNVAQCAPPTKKYLCNTLNHTIDYERRRSLMVLELFGIVEFAEGIERAVN
jgi:hypothetical protein